MDRSGAILSTLNITSDVGNPLSAADQQHEGITMDRAGLIYVVNENGGGSIGIHGSMHQSSLSNVAPTAVVLNNAVNSLEENASTASPIKVGDIVVTDDGLGTNALSLTGADVASFEDHRQFFVSQVRRRARFRNKDQLRQSPSMQTTPPSAPRQM